MASQKVETFTFYSVSTGAPLSGLTPTFTTYVLTDGTPVLPLPTISPMASGGYKFTPAFALPNEAIYYEVQPNSATASPLYFSRLIRPEDFSSDAASVWEELITGHQTANSMGRVLNDVLRLLKNKAIINPSNKQLEVYNDSGSTIVFTFDLKDDVGVASVLQIFQRIPA